MSSSSFCDKVLVIEYKTECEGSSIFEEILQDLAECRNNKTCIYQSMYALIEKNGQFRKM